MANVKISELAANTSAGGSDVLAIVPSGNAATQKITKQNFLKGAKSVTFTVASSEAKNTSGADYVCTGTNDDQTIQSAINALPSVGGIIYLSEGTYYLSGTINVTTNCVSLIGAGAGATIFRTTAGNETLANIVLGDGINTIAHCKLSGILFNSVNQKTANQAIKIQKGFKTWLSELRIENQYNGVYILNSTITNFRDSDLRDNKNDGIIWESTIGNGFDLYLNNISSDNPNVSNSGSGINWLGGENLVIQNCDFEHYTNGFLISPATSHQCRFGFFVNSEFDTCSNNGINISNTNGGDVVGLTFTNSWTGTCTNYGIFIEAPGGGLVQGVRFIGHKSLHNGLSGIRIAGGSDIHLLGCDVVGNSQTVSGSRSGIEITAGVTNNITVLNCNSKNGYQQGSTQAYGLNIDTGTYSSVYIMGNDFVGNSTRAININSSTGLTMFGNLGYRNPTQVFFDHSADAGNTHTDGSTYDDLYSDTLAAGQLANDRDKIIATYAGQFVSSATATREIKVLFAGSSIFDSGSLTTASNEDWEIDVTIVRESSSIVRCITKMVSTTSTGSTTVLVNKYQALTSLTLSNTQILKIQAVSGGTGAAANDIVAKLGTVEYKPAAN